jgi:STE24 endopeptidase
VAQHRAQVPGAFAQTITLAPTKRRPTTPSPSPLWLLELALGTAVLLGWTCWAACRREPGPAGMAGRRHGQQLALLAAFVLISGVIDLPLTLYQTFVIEERFGFNKMTLKLWLADLLKSSLVGL